MTKFEFILVSLFVLRHNGGMSVHVNLDDAWDVGRLGMRQVPALEWGPRLRYAAPRRMLERAFAELWGKIAGELFVLYGSGDFHHLAAWWLRGVLARTGDKNIVLVTFDNHPDWDVRPPRWACGGWINRALECEGVAKASVWGCGNFELRWPSRWFRNCWAMELGRLEVHAWAERQTPGVAKRFHCMNGGDWRERFGRFARSVRGMPVYVSIDMDALVETEAVSNWEQGLFAAEDVAWALRELRGWARVIGGDMCGAFSYPVYDRAWQRFMGNWDHPPPPSLHRDLEQARQVNHRALEMIWPALTGA
ncbi:MAG: hypothetical protein FWD61_20715 [Phycisphaerales bacterium]|nr:hypothetical protein [Phycisphaerales bacterium]